MTIKIWAVGKQYEFTHKQARATFEQLRELFEPVLEEPPVIDMRGDGLQRVLPASLFANTNETVTR